MIAEQIEMLETLEQDIRTLSDRFAAKNDWVPAQELEDLRMRVFEMRKKLDASLGDVAPRTLENEKKRQMETTNERLS